MQLYFQKTKYETPFSSLIWKMRDQQVYMF